MLTSESAKNHPHMFSSWVKVVKAGYTRDASCKKRQCQSLNETLRIFFPLNNRPDVVWHVSERY